MITSRLAALGLATSLLTACALVRPPARFTVVEATIPDLQKAMEDGRATSRDIVMEYLARIAFYDTTLNAVMVVNRRALVAADALDRERAGGAVRGPLHGVPIAL